MMLKRGRSGAFAIVIAAASLSIAGCNHRSGRPGPGPEVVRPEQVLDFATLYKTNCSGCHGENGKGGPALALANPVYLAVSGETALREVTAKGVPGKLMPSFAKSAGGTLTDEQVTVLAHGIAQQWGRAGSLPAGSYPTYKVSLAGDVANGQQAYATFCASCHGVSGEGKTIQVAGREAKLGSIVDESYLALVSDQSLRSIIIAGLPDGVMPDWRNDAATAMSDQQITDVVAWMASKRTANPGQPYAAHP